MKVLLLTAALIAASTTAFAQNSKVKAKSFKNVSVTEESTSETSTSSSQEVDAAATTSKTEIKKTSTSSTIIHQGVRVGVKKGNYDGELELKVLGFSGKDDFDVKNKASLSVGYELLNLQNIGIIVDFTYRNLEAEGEKMNSYSLEGSATYAFVPMFYALGGLSLNYAKLPNFDDEDLGSLEHKPEVGVGLQAGVGFKAHKNISIELMYNYLRSEGKYEVSGIDIETISTVKGFELGLIGTF